MTNFGAKRFKLNLINLKGELIGKIWESCIWGRQPEVVIGNRSEPNYGAATLHSSILYRIRLRLIADELGKISNCQLLTM